MATTVFPHNFFSENNVHEMIVLSSLHRIHILRYSVYCRLYTVRCKTGMFVFVTLYDSWSSCVADVSGWEAFQCVIMEWEIEEVGHGLNIPGRVVGGDYRCKEMVRVNAFMGGPLGGCAIADTRLWWTVSCLLIHFVVCYKVLPPEWKGGCNYGKMEGKNWSWWVFCLSFISPFYFLVKTR